MFQFGKKVADELFEIYYDALSKEKPEFGEIPHRYSRVIQQTLEDDILIQAGREKDLPPLSMMGKLSVLAFQKAQNRVAAETRDRNRHEAD